MGGLWRWILQVVLVILVGFFGYHYFTREELQGCISIPLASLGQENQIISTVDETKVKEFMAAVASVGSNAVAKGEALWSSVKVADATSSSAKMQDELLNKGQYLYCKTVVERVENEV